MRFKSIQDGFGVALVLVVISFALVAVLGWYVWQQRTSKTDTPVSQAANGANTTKSTPSTASNTVVDTTTWVKKIDKVIGVQYSVPPTWGEQVVLEHFLLDEKIPIGFGNPLYVQYDQQKQAWQTLALDDSGASTVVRADNIVETATVKVDGTYPTSYYYTGDGPASETHVLVVRGQNAFQFSLPTACDMCEESPKHTEQEIKDALPAFIQGITFQM